jgi:Tfp pilus assembly protein PilF
MAHGPISTRKIKLGINGAITTLIEDGNNNLKSKKFEKAYEAFDNALQLDTSNEKAFAGKIESLRGLHRYSDAEKAIREGLAKLPKNAEIMNQWGSLYLIRSNTMRQLKSQTKF